MLLFSYLEQVKALLQQYHDRLVLCESQKWDLEYEVKKRDYEVYIIKKKRLGLSGHLNYIPFNCYTHY